ncbi:MAG: hypothetical protein NT045_09725, partial [Candidatus Aureabacteria bacterium]|nr:hypothetical protein [Candidatus Auribacterota bacterium]
MAKAAHRPLLQKVKTIPLAGRQHKVALSMFAKPTRTRGSFKEFIDSLPHILAGQSFRDCVQAIVNARGRSKPVIAALGGHVIKCGCSRILIDLMRRRVVTAVAMNGAASIHDF